jgi:hypothetical protein
MKRFIKRNSTSQSIDIFIQNSSSTTGAGLTGLVFNSAGLTCVQRVNNGTAATVTLATLVSGTSAYSSGGFITASATLMAGVYRFDIPNTLLTTAGALILYFSGATNMAPVVVEILVTEFDIYDVVRGGLTAIPNQAQGTAGSLPTADATGRVTVATNADKTGYALSGTQAFNVTGNITGNLSGSVGSVTGNVSGSVGSVTGNVTGSVGSIASGGITTGSFAAGAINAAAVAAGAIDADALATDAVEEIADGILKRNLDSSGNEASTTSSGRTVRNALRILRNKVDASSGTQVDVYNEADTSVIWSQAITTSVSADPIVKVGT